MLSGSLPSSRARHRVWSSAAFSVVVRGVTCINPLRAAFPLSVASTSYEKNS